MTQILIVILALAFALPVWADFTGNAVGVADGDTITVFGTDKVQASLPA
jgi:hypothetical protein